MVPGNDEPEEDIDDINREGTLSSVPTEAGEIGVCFSDCGGPGDEIWGPEMDSLTGGGPRTFGEDGENLDCSPVEASTSGRFGDREKALGAENGSFILNSMSPVVVRVGGGGDNGGC